MHGYKTVEERADDWNVTPRHIQYLCRTGKIQGAIKRAGSWFIPVDAPTPVKNTKTDAEVFNFTGTKSKIFNSAIQLFMLKGFPSVSLRDIANSVGIQQSTIYNHFSSKQGLLDAIYDFYCHYYLKDRPSLRDIEPIIQNGSPLEILQCIRYDFNEEYRQKMSDITKIIFQRLAIDERAKEIGKTLMVDEGVAYVEAVLAKAIRAGRFAPFDTHTVAVFINSIRIFTLYNWIIDSSHDNMNSILKDEYNLYEHAAELIERLIAAAQK